MKTDNAAPTLPYHVVEEEILPRLPARSLWRFRCVSKSWNMTISSHEFSKTQLQCMSTLRHKAILLKDKLKLLSLHSLLNQTKFNVDFAFPITEDVTCVGSCNGLLCLALDNINVILWNPCTGKFKKLPNCGYDITTSIACCTYGFGFDKSRDDYKVVGFCRKLWDPVVVMLYSLKLDRWKTIKSCKFGMKPGWVTAFANGKLHWQVTYEWGPVTDHDLAHYHPDRNEVTYTWPWYISYLDMETEEHGILRKPDFVEAGFHSNLVESEGFLYVYCQHRERGEVWKIDGYGVGKEIWTKIVTIRDNRFQMHDLNKLVYVGKKGDMMFSRKGKIVIFSARDCSLTYPSISSGTFEDVVSGPYLESLISPIV